MKAYPANRLTLRLLTSILPIVGFSAWPVTLSAENIPPPATGRVVAITFDDLPYASEGSAISTKAAIDAQHRIVHTLRQAHVPATGFVNEVKVVALGPVGPRLLAEWNKGLLALGNHGYSHFDSNDLNVESIEREVVRGQTTIRPMAASVGRSIPFFRFPYNHIGDTEFKRSASGEGHLAGNGLS
ncbi:MAG: hypothetical protein EOP64_06825 [Sphingomonas sp.]|nr:MAG: hypothetical protein EOP64_06825 [Sphingomonas sp.]